jgi:quercetin dioxygenase-like cupin family protein
MTDRDQPAAGGRFTPARVTLSEQPVFSGFPGISMQALSGANLMLNRVVLAPGAVVPEHSHRHEQGGFILDGLLRLTVAGETWDLLPGDAYVMPGDTPHSATVGPEGCVVLDIFAPPREDYLALLQP